KDKAIDKFVLYKNEVENQLRKIIKVVQIDRQNGIAERKNCTLKEMVTAMLISFGMSQDMWEEAILTATYLLNKIPRKEKEETLYELWMGRKPSYQYLRVWGCLAKVDVPTPKAQKIGPESVDCIFIGYAKNNMHGWANWISDIKDSRSTSGYVFTLGGAAISWKSSKQTVIAKSTMESEFIALVISERGGMATVYVEDIPGGLRTGNGHSIHCDRKSAMGRALKVTMYNGSPDLIRVDITRYDNILSTGFSQLTMWRQSMNHLCEREVAVAYSKGFRGGAIPMSSCKNQASAHSMTGTLMRTWTRSRRVLVVIYWSFAFSPREASQEPNYDQNGVEMNEISWLKVRHVEHESGTIPHRPKCEVRLSSPAVQQLWTLYPGKQTANLMTNTQTPPPATTVVIPTGAPATNTVANHAERPEKFNGQNFKRWQQKMFFYLTTLGLARFLKETAPQVEPPAEDPLYNVYCKTATAKELLESINVGSYPHKGKEKAREKEEIKVKTEEKVFENEKEAEEANANAKLAMKKPKWQRVIRQTHHHMSENLSHMHEMVKRVIAQEIRVLAASMTMVDIFIGTEFNEVFGKIQLELKDFGLLIYLANVKQPVDTPGGEYFGI
ncbi:retrovirus-related pol polyprotein from transposon TNT 1-94, partial [Tanacetum coccineum]